MPININPPSQQYIPPTKDSIEILKNKYLACFQRVFSQEEKQDLDQQLQKPVIQLSVIASNQHHPFHPFAKQFLERIQDIAEGTLSLECAQKGGVRYLKLGDESLAFQRSAVFFKGYGEFSHILKEIEITLAKAFEKDQKDTTETLPQVIKGIMTFNARMDRAMSKLPRRDWGIDYLSNTILKLFEFCGLTAWIDEGLQSLKKSYLEAKEEIKDQEGGPSLNQHLSTLAAPLFDNAQEEEMTPGAYLLKQFINYGFLINCLNFFHKGGYDKKLNKVDKIRQALVMNFLKASREGSVLSMSDEQFILTLVLGVSELNGCLEAMKIEGKRGLTYHLVYRGLDLVQREMTKQALDGLHLESLVGEGLIHFFLSSIIDGTIDELGHSSKDWIAMQVIQAVFPEEEVPIN